MRWSKILILAAVIVVIIAVGISAFAPLQVFSNNKQLPWVQENITLGLDLQGGVHVVLEAQENENTKITPDAMKRAKAIIQERVNQLGVSEPVIQIQGDRRVIVELAGVKNPEKAVQDMIKTAFLEFKTEDGITVLTGKALKDAQASRDPNSGAVDVNLTFTSEGAKKFANITRENVGNPLGIYLDGSMLQNPTIQDAILNGKARITGYANLEEANRMSILLRSGALPVDLDVIQKMSVGPQLGRDSLNSSVQAGIVGFIAILVFMGFYYRIPGLVADLALLIYTLIVLAIFIGIGAVMTLPGIAGFLLTLGIAVDANVIIFERIKEEMRSGKSLRPAIDAGFKRGLVAVIDANVTTLLVAIVLYYFSTSVFRGFAVTLSIGIIASMFTAITLTRWILKLAASSNIVNNTKMYGA
ncbi:MAG: protein translocase subunit SecD [Clostridiales bacterium]|nr:protein translocase subunit SecD [Clostridiales bacterium]MCF8022119.1 protein translocase subunit SecD [Clostridiales bacterium]